jgi:hypothetical protein
MYLTPNEAATRLKDRYGVEDTPRIGDLMIASDALDGMAPFEDVDLDAGPIPDALLDYVALKAHVLARDRQEGQTSSSLGPMSHSFAWPQLSPDARRLDALLRPYLKRTGSRV